MDGELWDGLYQFIEAVDKQHSQDPRKRHRDATVVATYLYAVLHDRPVCWACDERNWPSGVRRPPPGPPPPSQPTMSRRLRDDPGVRRFRAELATGLDGALCLCALLLVGWIDGKPLPVAWHSSDPDADVGRGAGRQQRGYKLHTLWHDGRVLPIWEVRPMSASESTVARRLVAQLPDGDGEGEAKGGGGGYVLGDSAFDTNDLHARCAARGRQLLAPRKHADARGLGHRRHHPARLHALEMLTRDSGVRLLKLRGQVERRLGNLSSFGGGLSPLPAWVRRLSRVRLWVEAKLCINAIRIRMLLERVR
jgi:hypothetical protein